MMTRKKSTLLFLSLLTVSIILSSCTSNEVATYFDANWNETTKEYASYYRTTPKKVNNIWNIRDFYISGEKQFVGQTRDSSATIFEGDVTWYFKSGKVESKIRYKNGEKVGGFAALEGAIGSEKGGWDEKDLYYYDLGRVADAQAATVSIRNLGTDVFGANYTNTTTPATEHTRNVVSDDEYTIKSLFFDMKGDTIGRLHYDGGSDEREGKEIVFYTTEVEGEVEMNSIKEIKIYSKGVLEHSEYFNANEEKIAEGSFKNKKPFTGTFFKEACWFNKIQHYEKGSLLKEVTSNHLNEKIGEISFKDGEPNTGVLCKCGYLENYKNGKLDGAFIKYMYGGIGEDLKEEFNFNYKNGVKHGDYTIHEEGGMLLEKGTYENGRQVGEVWYYHTHDAIEEGDFDQYYYLKANIQSVNNKPFISEFSQFNLDDNELLQTFELEYNTSDKFTYLNNGFHVVYRQDFNGDGFDDLQIRYDHHTDAVRSNTFYLYNSATKKYQHLAGLDIADGIEVNTSEKTIRATVSSQIEGELAYITYGFLKNKLIKKLEIESVYSQEKDTTFLTQVFPVPSSDFPLMDNTLPPITFIQRGVEHQITKTHQTLNLDKAPFSVVLPGLVNAAFPKDFTAKITASYNATVFEKALVNQREEETDIFGYANTFARYPNFLIINDDGNNVFYYDDSEHASLDYIKNINEDVLLLRSNIEVVHYEGKEKDISEVDKPIYLMIYMDKNENKKIDPNELFYVTLRW